MVGWVVIIFGIVLIYAAVTGKGGQVVGAILPKGTGGSSASGAGGTTTISGASNPGSGQVNTPGGTVNNPSSTPATVLQHLEWDCSMAASTWLLEAEGAVGLTEDNVRNAGVNAGIVNAVVGLKDATGGALSNFLRNSYGLASHAQQLSFEQASGLASQGIPFIVGASGWGSGGHWSGVSGFDPATGQLSLANPSPGYGGIGTTLSKSQWAMLGPVYGVIPN